MHQRFSAPKRFNNFYYLNFPKVSEFFSLSFMETMHEYRDVSNTTRNFQKDNLPLKDCINKKYQNYKNIDWTDGSLFVFWHTPLIPLPIHSDIDFQYSEYKTGYGVNFNLYNKSSIHFYGKDSLIPFDKTTLKNKDTISEPEKAILNKFAGSRATLYTAIDKPFESYETVHNDVYLINTTTPHQLLAERGRICLSIRLNYFIDKSWDYFCDSFKDSIKL